MKKILLVGAAGYFGSKLQECLINEKINFEITDINYFKNCTIAKKKEKKISSKCASKLSENYLKNFSTKPLKKMKKNFMIKNINI